MTWEVGRSWPTLELQNSKKKLKELIDLLDEFGNEPPEVSSELARFLVVRSTGYVEHLFDTCIQCFAEAHSHRFVARHVESGLHKGRNVNPDTLLKRIKPFSDEWHKDLEEYLDADSGHIKRELKFMVDRRNRIAHGMNESINRRAALDLAKIALDLGDLLMDIMDPR